MTDNDLDYGALAGPAAAIVVAAVQATGGGNRAQLLDKVAELVVLAGDAAQALHAATFRPEEDKTPISVVGIITGVDGNRLEWHDDDPARESRQGFAGADAVTRHAVRSASKLVGRKCLIHIGWTMGRNAKGSVAPLRRVLKVTPIDGARPAAPPPAAVAAAPDPVPTTPAPAPAPHVAAAAAAARPAPAPASAVVGTVPDGTPAEIVDVVRRSMAGAPDDAPSAEDLDALKAALRCFKVSEQRDLPTLAAQAGVRSYTRPATLSELGKVGMVLSRKSRGAVLAS